MPTDCSCEPCFRGWRQNYRVASERQTRCSWSSGLRPHNTSPSPHDLLQGLWNPEVFQCARHSRQLFGDEQQCITYLFIYLRHIVDTICVKLKPSRSQQHSGGFTYNSRTLRHARERFLRAKRVSCCWDQMAAEADSTCLGSREGHSGAEICTQHIRTRHWEAALHNSVALQWPLKRVACFSDSIYEKCFTQSCYLSSDFPDFGSGLVWFYTVS